MMKPYVVIPPAEFDAMVGQAALQLPAIKQRFGKSTGKEFISERKVGDSVAELLYPHKFELSAMRWTFYLYKGEEGWAINTFNLSALNNSQHADFIGELVLIGYPESPETVF